MPESNSFQVIQPPNLLKSKVPRYGGPSIDDIKAKAEAGLKSLEGEFLVSAFDEISEIEKALKLARDEPPGAELAQKRAISHATQIKGLAASFGYDALGEAGSLLADYLSKVKPGERIREDVTEAHLGAMLVILNERMTGPYEAAPLIEALETLSLKV
ncbi:MAG: Hpt domain-containing protein [Kiloniellales bacterium]|nr:Hpt domain-containing protein [Kiloniellales bacterium]